MSAKYLACLTLFFATTATCLYANAKTIAEPHAASIFSGELGMSVANQYMTRGFVVQDEGVSFQPYLDLNATFYEGEGFVNAATAFISLWSAIGSTPYADTDKDVGQFTEFDYSFGISIDFAERWTFTTFYNRWTSPAGAYEDGDWISVILELDDQWLYPGNFCLEPFLQITHEFGSDLAPGLCFEPGIRPNVTLFSDSVAPVNVGVLIMAGLGSGYYGVDYGYFATGPQLIVPIGGSSDLTGSRWTVSAECLYFDFGRTTTEENGQEDSWLVSFKVAYSF